jgi:hypothetical protein
VHPDLEHARAAKDRLAGLIDDPPALNGIGIAPLEDGYCIKINLEWPSDDDFPQEVDGVPVRVEVVGPIRKRHPD